MSRTLRDDRINRILYISLGGVVGLIILFIVLFNVFSSKNKNDDNLQIGENSSNNAVEEANSSIGKTVDESIENQESEENIQVKTADNSEEASNLNEDLDTTENETENNTAETAETVETTETSNNTSVQEQDPTFVMPVEGEIVKHYGKEQLIYSDTLKEWTTHLGIDVKADKTSIVKASADGVVKSIKNDPRFGLTVVLEHQNGFTTVYSNLLSTEFVVQGETIKAGQTLGTVGNSATFEILDDPHLHFEIIKDGNSIDPEMYIK